jgi:hypothetical protein
MEATPEPKDATPARPKTGRTPIPRDGGTLLGAGAVLGGLSAVTALDGLRVGAGGYPVWPVAAMDAAIAAVAGGLLLFGSKFFSEAIGPESSDFVPVRKEVWAAVQTEIAANRLVRARGRVAVAVPPPAEPEALAPWDEGPPSAVPAPVIAPASVMPPSPVIPPTPAPVTPAPALPKAAPIVIAPPAPPTTQKAPAKLTREDLEEIEKLRGILGITAPLPRRDLTGVPSSAGPAGAASADSSKPRPEARPARSDELPEIDELMSWLDRMSAERTTTTRPKPKTEPGQGSETEPK